MTAILGISAFYHDSAAALVIDGEIVAAAQEERFTRKKHDHEFPFNAINYCLEEGRVKPEELDFVGFYDKPFLKFERLLETYLAYAPLGFRSFTKAMPLWLRQKLHLPRVMNKGLRHKYKKRYIFTEHHESHAASAFFPSPFEEAAILTLDGVGEWATAAFGIGRGNRIELSHQLRFPHSLGLLYSAFTYFTGFKVNSGEYKLMGLAPYGEPVYCDLIFDNLMDLKEDGSFRLNMDYFAYLGDLKMINDKFSDLFGFRPRNPEGPIERQYMDVAASIQKVTEEIVIRIARHVRKTTGMRNLCLAGGVALNCVANGKIVESGLFDNIWIQPAAGDAGSALGVALFIWHQLLDNPRAPNPADGQHGSLLGPEYSDDEIEAFLESTNASWTRIDDDAALVERVADSLAEGEVVGWFQGRMEWGPRSLGARSILADARNLDNWKRVNLKIKFRESFRPFAPAILAEKADEWFDLDRESPYMLLVCQVKEGKNVPAITHKDGSARVQTVTRETHAEFYDLLHAFDERTDCPLLINTSFNVRGEPIVCSPEDAYLCFMRTNMDVLVLGNQILLKPDQPEFHEDFDWRERYALD